MAVVMEGSRHQLLPRAGLTSDDDARIGSGDPVDDPEDPLYLGALPDEVVGLVGLGGRRRTAVGRPLLVPAGKRPLDLEAQLGNAEGPLQQAEGAFLDRLEPFSGRCQVSVHDDDGLGVADTGCPHQVADVAARHRDAGDDHVMAAFLHVPDGAGIV